MKKASTIKSKVFTGVIAAVCAVSVISTGAIIGASAFSSASSNADTAVIERRTSGSTFTLPMKGVDWNYFSDSLDVTVDCEQFMQLQIYGDQTGCGKYHASDKEH